MESFEDKNEKAPDPYKQELIRLVKILEEIDLNTIKTHDKRATRIWLNTKTDEEVSAESLSDDSAMESYEDAPVNRQASFSGIGISLSYRGGTYRWGQSEIYNIFYDVPDGLLDAYKEYLEKIRQIEDVMNRQIGPERTNVLLQKLETQRKNIHQKGAQMIVDYNKERSMSKIIIEPETARKLFEVLFYLWQMNQEDRITYTGNQYEILMDKQFIGKLQKLIKDRMGIDLQFDAPIYFGFHEDDPTLLCNINLVGKEVSVHKTEIRRLIDQEIAKAS